MADWKNNLDAFLVGIWAELGDFTRARSGYPGLAVLGTSGPSGPELRNVVLRKADRSVAQLVVHTDHATPKVSEILNEPNVTILVWNADNDLQIRAKGRAEVLGAYAAEDVWATLPFASQGNYGVAPAPGTVIPASHAYERLPDRSRLAVIAVTLTEIDAVQLCEPHHIRARYREQDGWRGNWIAP